MTLAKLYDVLNEVLSGKVYYAFNSYDNIDNATLPFIVYQEVSKVPYRYSDDRPTYYVSTIQISLLTRSKDTELESKLEAALLKNNLSFSMLSESKNEDKSINRVYEIKMEDF